MNDVHALRKAIHDLHGYESTHLRSENIHETFRGKTVWSGTVEIFELLGHPGAGLCYAWQYLDGDETRYITVLGKLPISSARDAVRAFVVKEAQNSRSQESCGNHG